LTTQIGDPKNLSFNQISEAISALNQTAQELQKACVGIQEFANDLQGQQQALRLSSNPNSVQPVQFESNVNQIQLQIPRQINE